MRETIYRLDVPVSIALLTDLHERDYSFLSTLRPVDMIAVAGDVVYGRAEDDLVAKRVLPFFRACASIAPTFFAVGNHEWMFSPADFELISSTGVTVLENRWVQFREGIWIGGLSSAAYTDYNKWRGDREGYPKRKEWNETKPQPDMEWLRKVPEGYRILLSHHPEYFPLVPPSVQLIASGHSHGGQIGFYDPFLRRWRGLFAPGQGWFPKYTSGVYDGRLVVSRGLANTAPVPRICNPTEVVYILPNHHHTTRINP